MKKSELSNQDAERLLDELLASTAGLTAKDRAELETAGRKLDRDPAFVADYLKGLFVEDLRRALDEDGLSQNQLAARVGKSRQYVSKVLNQDRRVNFTLETLAAFSVALGRPLTLRMLPKSERVTVFQVVSPSMKFSPMDADDSDAGEPASTFPPEEFSTTSMSVSAPGGIHDQVCVPA